MGLRKKDSYVLGKISPKILPKKIKMMLGRKQSLKGEPVLADYGPDEAFNESADIEWVNKVKLIPLIVPLYYLFILFLLKAMGQKTNERMCPIKPCLSKL